MKKKPLPTHADEVDALRLQIALIKANEAGAAYAQLLAAAERKYHFEHNKGEGIDFATRQIARVKRDGD